MHKQVVYKNFIVPHAYTLLNIFLHGESNEVLEVTIFFHFNLAITYISSQPNQRSSQSNPYWDFGELLKDSAFQMIRWCSMTLLLLSTTRIYSTVLHYMWSCGWSRTSFGVDCLPERWHFLCLGVVYRCFWSKNSKNAHRVGFDLYSKF